MKSETALLIDTDLSRTLSTSLRAILEPLFRLDSIVHKGPETVFSRDDLGTLKDAQPVLIFVILSNSSA